MRSIECFELNSIVRVEMDKVFLTKLEALKEASRLIGIEIIKYENAIDPNTNRPSTGH